MQGQTQPLLTSCMLCFQVPQTELLHCAVDLLFHRSQAPNLTSSNTHTLSLTSLPVACTTLPPPLPSPQAPLSPLGVGVVSIPGFTHPVRQLWLEDALEATGHVVGERSR